MPLLFRYLKMQWFFFYLQFALTGDGKKFLRKLKYDDNTDNNCNCILQSRSASSESTFHIFHNQFVDCPVDADTRYQRKQSRYHKNCHRTAFSDCNQPRQNNHQYGCQKSGQHSVSKLLRHPVCQPSCGTNCPTPGKIPFGYTEQQCKSDGSDKSHDTFF